MDIPEELKKMAEGHILRLTKSLCPQCVEEGKFENMKIDSVVYEKDGKVWQIKKCPEHGVIKSLYWSDYEMYEKAKKYAGNGLKLENPHSQGDGSACPTTCGLCGGHKSHTALGNIVLTNRCDLSCWYCFFFAKEGGYVYEPSIEQIKTMLQSMRNEKPVGCNAVQFTGGEPTLREDLIEIIKLARQEGYEHIQINTDGINLAKNKDLAKQMREAGASTLYLSFDGVSPETNPKNYWEVPSAIENCKQAGLGIVLVPTIIGGVNEHELGDIIRFASGNLDPVRAVNFQPVSLVGRMPDKMRKEQRITIPGAIKRIEAQTNGEIAKDDFFPVPCTTRITDFIEAIKNKKEYRLSTHFACGMGTYVFKENEKLIPITRFVDVDGFFNYLKRLTDEINKSKMKKIKKTIALSKLLFNIKKFIDEDKKPKGIKIYDLISSFLKKGDYNSLGEFHYKSLFIGMMHFQDPYNWDIERVQRCCIHYAVPNKKVIPFCSFNVIPNLYRDKIQKAFGIPVEEWEKQTGKKLMDDKYKRSITEEEESKLKEFYNQYKKPYGKEKFVEWES